jgi:hypothetical protein
VPPTGTRFAVPAASWCPGCPDADRALVAVRLSVSVHMSSVRPPSVRRPTRVQRPARPVPERPVPERPVPERPVPERPVSGVRCPVSGCPVRASGIRVHVVRTGELVECLGTVGSHTSRDKLGRVTDGPAGARLRADLTA